jgi:uncharacterized membrane protein YraQ (UPF0718 family)
MGFVTTWALQTWYTFADAAPWLLFGFVVAGIVYVLLPVDKVTGHLGRPGLTGIVKAALIGIPLPLCSCSVIPVASAIKKRGASRGAFVSFLVSTPETGVDSIAISYALLGPLLAVIRPIAAFLSAVAAGVLVNRFAGLEGPNDESRPGDPETGAACCVSCGCDTEGSARPRGTIGEALRYGLVDMFKDLSPWLVAGFVLAGLFSALLPEGFLERYVGGGPAAMLLMLVVGLPLYVCATSSTPVAAVLIAGGLSPGAALVFLLAGPATNIATMLIVARDTGRRGLVIYLVSIAVVAVAVGLVTDRLIPVVPPILALPEGHAEGHLGLGAFCAAVALAVLILNGLRLRLVSHVRANDPTVTGARGEEA